FREAMNSPIGCSPVKDRVGADETVAVVIPDITRALPNERLLGWLFAELDQVRPENVVIISGTGTHRENTEAEWIQMVGAEIFRRYRCINHRGGDLATMAPAGKSPFGYDVHFNREYCEADRRILLGFIEPHFMAGFSGGYKAAFPGVTSVDAIMHYHSAENIRHPNSTWGVLVDNPTQDQVRAGGALVPVDLLINVTLNNRREITRYFVGDPIVAHEAGCEFCRATAMVECEQAFDVVVTSNSGYPLDQNLYQAVKGMSAASKITRDGGLIIMAARCNDGFPDHGNFKDFLFSHASAQAMLDQIDSPGFRKMDQWQVQMFALILKQARVALFSELSRDAVTQAHLEPVKDIRSRIDEEAARLGRPLRIAVMPEGPMTIPFLST
ncbi:MAG: nickel-dependent lactate racemase, partial [Opitutaceae bacterium]|nr:nickel-dependent lactate racemase [Opitutaceae bacterium]